MKMELNWEQKLTSRKFWAAVIGFVSQLLLAFGVADNVVSQVAGVTIAGATLIAYIVGEGLVDSVRETAKFDLDDKGDGI